MKWGGGGGERREVPFFPLPHPLLSAFLLSPHFLPSPNAKDPPRCLNFVHVEWERLLHRLIVQTVPSCQFHSQGHSQLAHGHIRYHFIADLPVTETHNPYCFFPVSFLHKADCVPLNVACVASVCVGFGSKERDSWCFARVENGERAKNEIWGWGRGRKETLADKPLDFENLRSSWLAGLVKNYWQVSIKGLSLLGAREKWNWYVYKERSLFSPNEDFVMRFDNRVEIL